MAWNKMVGGHGADLDPWGQAQIRARVSLWQEAASIQQNSGLGPCRPSVRGVDKFVGAVIRVAECGRKVSPGLSAWLGGAKAARVNAAGGD